MTRSDNPSRQSYRYRNVTKECFKCKFNVTIKERKVCTFGGLIKYIFTKTNKVRSNCLLKR